MGELFDGDFSFESLLFFRILFGRNINKAKTNIAQTKSMGKKLHRELAADGLFARGF
jgi:hypothetical protein